MTDPPEEPLEGLEPVGDHILVAAETAVLAPADKPFLIGLPVPDGHDESNLAAAVLVPADQVLDGPESGEVWSLTKGSVDAASGLYVIPLAALGPSPTIVVLVDVPADEEAAVAFRASAQLTADGYDFFVICTDLFQFPGCRKSKEFIRDAFVAAYDEFVTVNDYPQPYLNAWVGSFPLAPQVPSVTWGNVLGTIQITPDEVPPCSRGGQPYEKGQYNPANFNITICVDRRTGDLDGTAPPSQPKLLDTAVETIRHELFHAIQHSYPNVRAAPDLDRKWTMDGTASAVQNPAGTLSRTLTRSLRRIDRSLVDETDAIEYLTQDFWVYFGRQRDPPLEETISKACSRTALTRLTRIYCSPATGPCWAWNTGHGSRTRRSKRPSTMTGAPQPLPHRDWADRDDRHPLVYPPVDVPQSVMEGILDRLTSAVVKIEFRGETGPIKVSADQVPNLRYKVYLDAEDTVVDGTPACVSVAEDAPREFAETPDQPVYVLLSNVLHPPGSQVRYTVRVEPAPSGE